MSRHRRSAVALALMLMPAPLAAEPQGYPHIPEPMIFDMIRPMGARRGELETNVLATTPLSGQDRVLEWAPEIEYAVVDNFAVEFELPFENARLAEVKMGLQGTFGTLDSGRIVHGVQYLGIYDRHDDSTSHALLYMLGRRHDAHWSTMTMVGVGDVRVGQPEAVGGMLVNHSTFYDLGAARVAGLEINYVSGSDGGLTMTPQFHFGLSQALSVQFGVGVDKQRGEKARPIAGLRLIREL